MRTTRKRAWQAALLSALMLVGIGTAIVTPTAAHADPGCQNVLLLFARGSGASLYPISGEAAAFFNGVGAQLGGTSHASVQLGDEDGDGGRPDGRNPNGIGTDGVDPGEYPAVTGAQWVAFPGYSSSVGVNELVGYLNQRVVECPNEKEVLGGYSQGAGVIGSALGSLSATAENHIAYVAYYGDPTYYNGGFLTCYNPALVGPIPWARGSAGCNSLNVPLAQRYPYLPPDFVNKTGSWCDAGDGLCTHNLQALPGTHTTAYQGTGGWIVRSAPEIASAVRGKLDTSSPPTSGGQDPPPPSRQLFLRGDSAVFAKDNLGNGGWTQETDPASEKAIAAGGGLQMVLDACNAVWARSTIGKEGWIQETPCGGAQKIAVSSTGLQMLLDANFAVHAKYGIGYDGWTRETPDYGATVIAVGGNTQVLIDADGAVFAKAWLGDGGWTKEHTPSNPADKANAITVDNTGLQAFIRGDAAVFAKRGIGDGGWQQQVGGGNAQAIATGGGVLMFLRGDSAVFAKTNIAIDGGWTQETDPGTANLIDVGDNGRQMIRTGDNAVWAKDGIGYGGWQQQVGGGNANAIAVG